MHGILCQSVPALDWIERTPMPTRNVVLTERQEKLLLRSSSGRAAIRTPVKCFAMGCGSWNNARRRMRASWKPCERRLSPVQARWMAEDSKRWKPWRVCKSFWKSSRRRSFPERPDGPSWTNRDGGFVSVPPRKSISRTSSTGRLTILARRSRASIRRRSFERLTNSQTVPKSSAKGASKGGQ